MKKYLTAALLLTFMLFISASTINSATTIFFETKETTQSGYYTKDYLNWEEFYNNLKDASKFYKIYEIYIERSESPRKDKSVLLREDSRGRFAYKFFNADEKVVVVFVAYVNIIERDRNRYGSFSKEYDREGLFDDAIAYWNECMNKYDGVPMS